MTARQRRAARRLWESRIERLEDRSLLAVNLVSISPNVGAFLVDGTVRNEAPRELTFKFSAGQVIDPTSLSAIHITRSGSDGVFQPASVYSDFNTNGAAIIEFDALQLGAGGNAISVVVTKSNRPSPGPGQPVPGPAVSVVGNAISVDLNTNVGNLTTANKLITAINTSLQASLLVQAKLRSAAATGTTDITTPVINYSPLALSGANAATATTNFNVATPLEVKFTAKAAGTAGNGISVSFTKSPRGNGAAPGITVPPAGTAILVDLNSTVGSETTAQGLATALANNAAANALVAVTIPVGSSATKIATSTITYSPLVLTADTVATGSTDFNVGSPLEVRFTAKAAGPSGNSISLFFTKADLGASTGPTINVAGQRIDVTLNSNATGFTTPQALVNAITANTAANALVSSAVTLGDAATTNIAASSITYSPVLLSGAQRGATDIPVTSTYVGIGNNPNEVVVRFADTLPDDLYRIEIFGTGAAPLKNVPATGQPVEVFNSGVDQRLSFRLDLGAQLVSVVPQPVLRDKQVTFNAVGQLVDGDRLTISDGQISKTFEFDTAAAPGIRATSDVAVQIGADALSTAANLATAIGASGLDVTAAAPPANVVTIQGNAFQPTTSLLLTNSAAISLTDGGLTQVSDVVDVSFNADQLNATSAQNPAFYQLIDVNANFTQVPTSVNYSRTANNAKLKFGAPLANSTYQLQLGTAAQATVATPVAPGGDDNSSFITATPLTAV
ncbi:MAG TPA: hypothetical protein VNM37_05125, partial [Candidatus Dormibacteraeota bacterium]|nr:hypothetical protein [Candidatus Dormibacteraeota bacterium]